MRTIAYMRVSTEEQARSGLGLEAQQDRITDEVERRGWELAATITDDGMSGSNLERPGITEALAMIDAGDADALMVAKLDRLSRSLLDFAALMDRSRREGWALIALDLGVDTSTPSGEMMAAVMAAFAQYERRLIGQRTRDALAVKRAAGMRLGRPVGLPGDVRDRIAAERAAGDTLTAIADELTAENVPTAQGGARWYAVDRRRGCAVRAARRGGGGMTTNDHTEEVDLEGTPQGDHDTDVEGDLRG